MNSKPTFGIFSKGLLTLLGCWNQHALADQKNIVSDLELLKTTDYYISSNTTFDYKPLAGGTTSSNSQTESAKGSLQNEFSRRGVKTAYRCLRVVGDNKIEFEAHAVSDGTLLKNVLFSKGMRTLYVTQLNDKLCAEIRPANLLDLRWTWLSVKESKDILSPDPLVWNDEVKNRLTKLLPIAMKGEFFDLPHAPGVQCKIDFNGNFTSIKHVVMMDKRIGLVWSCNVAEEHDVVVEVEIH